MRAWLGALAAAALAGCPSPPPPEPKAAPPATAAATESAASPASPAADAGVEPDPDAAATPAEPPAPKRQVSLMDYQLTAENVDCSATDEIRVIGYPAGVPDCDTQVICAVTAPKRAALLATGGDTALCERGALRRG